MRLSEAQRKVLALAATRPEINYYSACDVGARGRALSILVDKGYLEARKVVSGQLWRITLAGRSALDKESEPS